jgi:hypothetical protein
MRFYIVNRQYDFEDNSTYAVKSAEHLSPRLRFCRAEKFLLVSNSADDDAILLLVVVVRNIGVQSSHTLKATLFIFSSAVIPRCFGRDQVTHEHECHEAVFDIDRDQPVVRVIEIDKVHHDTAGNTTDRLPACRDKHLVTSAEGFHLTRRVPSRSSLLDIGWGQSQ